MAKYLCESGKWATPTTDEIGAVKTEAGSNYLIKYHNSVNFNDLDNFPLESEYGKSFIRIFKNTFDGIVIENSSTSGNYACQLYISSDGLKFRKRQTGKTYEAWKTISNITASDLGIASTQTTLTLTPSDWTGTSAPFTATRTISGITSTSIVDIDVPSTVTAEQLDAFINAKIVDGGQATNSITLKAFGDKPTVNIPIKVVIRKV